MDAGRKLEDRGCNATIGWSKPFSICTTCLGRGQFANRFDQVGRKVFAAHVKQLVTGVSLRELQGFL